METKEEMSELILDGYTIDELYLFSNEVKTINAKNISFKTLENMVDREKFNVTYTLVLESKCRSFNKEKSIILQLPYLLTTDIYESKLEIIEELVKAKILVKAVNDGEF